MKKKLLIVLSLFFIFAFSFAGMGMTYASSSQREIIVDALTTAENRTVQTKLKRWGYYKGSVDGIYGPKTKEAVRYFQRKNGLAFACKHTSC